ncbi:MAG: tRNA guanosine(34) transglycosylase Tgt [Endomicrobiia bacterium]
MQIFKVFHKDPHSQARTGVLSFKDFQITTPIFLPVGTLGVVKTLSYQDLKEIKVEAFIANTYHLYFRPGEEILKKFGGLKNFINWDKIIFTDSGGFQVYSLRELKKISEEGVEFKSHIDGSLHFFTPEKVIELQSVIGSDVAVCLDECVEYPVEYNYAKRAVEITTLWAKRSKKRFEELKKSNLNVTHQKLFGVIQGSVYKDLRKQSIEEILNLSFDGYAIGGLAVGEPRSLMWEVVEFISENLPEDLVRYIMGIGEIEDIFFCIEKGYDIMDCVLPTRNGRNGQALTSFGKLNIKNSKYSKDENPLDLECNCFVCKNYSRALLHHYYKSQELLVLRLMSYHNVYFMINLFKKIQEKINTDRFLEFKKEFLKKFSNSENE